MEEQYRTILQSVLDGWEANEFAEIVIKDGKATLDLSKDEKLPIPATVEPLREALLGVIPHVRLADVLIEVDDWVGLRGLFTHLNEREAAKTRDPRVDVALFAAILAHGLNLPLSTMAEATDIPYHELTHVSDWYVRDETLRRAVVALVDYQHSLPLSAAFGPGTTAMSDGIRFEVGARSLHAQHHARYFGPRRGVTLHDMISDQYSHPYIQIISPHIREAHAALDAILHHETELPIREMMVDTAGFTELMYALYDLQGLKLSPRIRDLADQRLHPVEGVSEYGVLKPLFRGPTSSYVWRNILPYVQGFGRIIAPDLIGMGDSQKLPESGPGSYTFVEHRRYLDALLEALDIRTRVVFVGHDWGAALAFDWARRHPEGVRCLAYMEAVMGTSSWSEMPEIARARFQALRSSQGEQLVLEQNSFIEFNLPKTILRTLTEEEMHQYRRPFAEVGEARRPTLSWARQLPIEGEPADVTEIVTASGRFLAETPIPKLLIQAVPGTQDPQKGAFNRTWPTQTEVSVRGHHTPQEDSPDEIGQAIASWLQELP